MATDRYELKIGSPQYPILDEFARCRDRVSFIMGPLGSGKTYTCVQRMLVQMCEQKPNAKGERPTRWCAVRNTYPDLMGTTVKDFLEIFDGLGRMKQGGLEPPTFHVVFRLPDCTTVKAEVIFLALDREDAVKKLRGMQVTGFWLNETKELVKPILDMADLRHGRYPTMVAGAVECTWHGIFGDTNAPDEDHWYYDLAELLKPKGWRFFKQPGGVTRAGVDHNGRVLWEPNPDAENLANLPEGYYSRGMQGKDDSWIAVNLANEYGFSLDGKPVHPEYVDSVHCSPVFIDYDPKAPVYLGVDFGRTPAAAILQPIESMGRWVVIDEFVTKDMSAALFGPELKRYLDRHYPEALIRGWGDPAGDQQGQSVETTPIQVLQAAGLPIQPAPSNQPVLRRASVSNPLTRICMDGRPALLISPRARMIRKGLAGGFCYRRLKVAGDERFTDVPDKNEYSHVVEALEYGLMGAGEGRAARRVQQEGVRQQVALM